METVRPMILLASRGGKDLRSLPGLPVPSQYNNSEATISTLPAVCQKIFSHHHKLGAYAQDVQMRSVSE